MKPTKIIMNNKYYQINQISALNNPHNVHMPLNK